MTDMLVTILIEVLIAAAVAGIIQFAPFITQPLKQYALYAVAAVLLVLIILALVPVLQGAAH